VDAVNYLLVALLVVAVLALVIVQAVARHRRLTSREASGQSALPKSTWIVFGASFAFLLFAVFVLPHLLRP
jgi:ABC-type Fe3+ transport system permease subunit